jgi:hypothetical protein
MSEEEGERFRKAMRNLRICGLMSRFDRQYRSDVSVYQTTWNVDGYVPRPYVQNQKLTVLIIGSYKAYLRSHTHVVIFELFHFLKV